MNEPKKLNISIATLVVLFLCLCVTAFALAYAMLRVDNNVFETGEIDIDLNGGKPVIEADEFLFEPGMTVEKSFYIKNNGTWAVYYKLYFSNVKGDLGDVLDVTIKNADGNVLLQGKLSKLKRHNVPVVEDELKVGDRRDMTIIFHFPEDAKNTAQSDNVSFALSALAVQTKNNDGKEFE